MELEKYINKGGFEEIKLSIMGHDFFMNKRVATLLKVRLDALLGADV